MNLSSLPVTSRAVIPESYLDLMVHMNVMWYTHLFSEAAWGLFQLVGLTLEHFTANKTGSFALTQHFRYLKEVRLGQHVTLRSRVLGRSAKRWHAIYFLDFALAFLTALILCVLELPFADALTFGFPFAFTLAVLALGFAFTLACARFLATEPPTREIHWAHGLGICSSSSMPWVHSTPASTPLTKSCVGGRLSAIDTSSPIEAAASEHGCTRR